MVFELETTVTRVSLSALNIDISARFLFHQQFIVCCHQVDSSLNAQSLTDERRFEDSFTLIIKTFSSRHLPEENPNNLSKIIALFVSILLELLSIKAGTGTKLQRLLLEISLESVTRIIMLLTVDDIVESTSRKVTK